LPLGSKRDLTSLGPAFPPSRAAHRVFGEQVEIKPSIPPNGSEYCGFILSASHIPKMAYRMSPNKGTAFAAAAFHTTSLHHSRFKIRRAAVWLHEMAYQFHLPFSLSKKKKKNFPTESSQYPVSSYRLPREPKKKFNWPQPAKALTRRPRRPDVRSAGSIKATYVWPWKALLRNTTCDTDAVRVLAIEAHFVSHTSTSYVHALVRSSLHPVQENTRRQTFTILSSYHAPDASLFPFERCR
jgi:hypothetical protein